MLQILINVLLNFSQNVVVDFKTVLFKHVGFGLVRCSFFCKVEFEAVQEWLFVVCRLNSKDAKLESSHVEKLGEVRNSCRFECTLCKVLQISNEYLVTRMGCDTAENEPYKI